MNQRNLAFDCIKGIAIIAVVLYHFGLCPNGYLGVDIFLVIAGFFTANSLWKLDDKSLVGGGKYLINRMLRLLPILLIAEIVIIVYGFLLMMPDDYENASQSVIATNFFANNILSDITTKNYWDAVNEYKPLMHTWYLGILMQFYVFFVIIDLIIYKLKGKQISSYLIAWAVISVASLILYFLDVSLSHKFYQIPFRIFEFGVGCLSFYLSICLPDRMADWTKSILVYISLLAVICLLFVPISFIPGQYILLVVVGLSGFLTYNFVQASYFNSKSRLIGLLAVIGAACFSLFVWHQIVFALTRYSFTSNLNTPVVVVMLLVIIAFLTILSYKYVESLKFDRRKIILVITMFCVVNASAFIIYKRSGVFYDIPELEVNVDNVQSGIWAKYCDRGFKYDRGYSDSLKPRWMVIGNSFGRDFVNIILESDISDKVDLSYAVNIQDKEHEKRLKDTDVVFISTLGLNKKLVSDVSSKISNNARLVVVGEKNFGVNNGQVFRKRHSSDYLNSTITMESGYEERNEENRQNYADDYIDMIAMATMSGGKVRVFSDDGRFISQDCRHLTRAGAQFYADKIDWSKYYKE